MWPAVSLRTLTLNVTMDVGSTATTVDVKAGAGAELQTTNATVGSTISGVSLLNLPNFGRDANAFFTLQPLTTPGGQVAGVIHDSTGSYRLAFLLAIACCIVSAGAIWMAGPRQVRVVPGRISRKP